MATAQDFLKNEKWRGRVEGFFSALDEDKDKKVSKADYERAVDNLAKFALELDRPNRKDAVDNAKAALFEFTDAAGLTEAKVDLEKYQEMVAPVFAADVTRKQNGEPTLLAKMDSAFFKVLNGDDCVTHDAYIKHLKALNLPTDAADAHFKALDPDSTGKVKQDALIEAHFNFWYTLDDPKTKGLYGASFK